MDRKGGQTVRAYRLSSDVVQLKPFSYLRSPTSLIYTGALSICAIHRGAFARDPNLTKDNEGREEKSGGIDRLIYTYQQRPSIQVHGASPCACVTYKKLKEDMLFVCFDPSPELVPEVGTQGFAKLDRT